VSVVSGISRGQTMQGSCSDGLVDAGLELDAPGGGVQRRDGAAVRVQGVMVKEVDEVATPYQYENQKN